MNITSLKNLYLKNLHNSIWTRLGRIKESYLLNYFILVTLCRFIFDAMHAVTGAYAKPIFVDKLGASLVCFKIS